MLGWRRLVGAPNVTRARPMSSNGTPMATEGHTLAAMPRSTNQASLRYGISLRLLVSIELNEQAVDDRNEVVVLGHIVGSQGHAAYQFGHKFRPIPVRKRFEFVEQLRRSLSHGDQIRI
jgi:hypothetical protein